MGYKCNSLMGMAKRRKGKSSPQKQRATTRALANAQRAAGEFRRAREGYRLLFRAGDRKAVEPYLEMSAACIQDELGRGEIATALLALRQVEETVPKNAPEAWSETWYQQVAMTALQLLRNADAPKVEWVDASVLAFTLPDDADEADSLICDARAIHAGLAALVQGDRPGLSESLRGIGRQSPFASWKWLLKGCGVLLESLLERYAQTRAIARCVRLLEISKTRT